MYTYFIYEQLDTTSYRYCGTMQADHWTEARSTASSIHGIPWGLVVACKNPLPSVLITN
jgi:hypothetical protein